MVASEWWTSVQATTKAVAELLAIAGVKYLVLGEGETYNGDSARRSGNEFLWTFEMGIGHPKCRFSNFVSYGDASTCNNASCLT